MLKKGFSYRFINDVDGMTGAQVAIAYVLKNPNISSAVFGTTSLKHLIENIDSVNKNIPQEVFNKIKSVNKQK